MEDYLSRWPGKSAGESGVEHPAVYHMLDVAAVAERLLIPFSYPEALKSALVLLAALHDLGKIGEPFRAMLRSGVRQEYKHWILTEAWLSDQPFLCEKLEADAYAWRSLIAAVAGHHGKPTPDGADRHFDTGRWWAGTEAAEDIPSIIADMAALWPDASLAGMTEGMAKHLSWPLAGMTTVADWVGSNTDWFPPQEPGPDLASYLEQARHRAVVALSRAGLDGAALRSGPLFDFPLRPMQAAAHDIALPPGPMLAFIEDDTGSGKTEAALILAQRMLAAGKGRGLYVALPTMATADAMFVRAESVVGKLFDAPSLTLAHGRAALSDRFRDLVGRPTVSDDATCAPWLADNRRRALLADIGIGTVDQALLAVLPARFFALRLWGLAQKILIVDEAHEIASDDYTGVLLAGLLRGHAALGGSAILLSATLPLGQRALLAQAFAEGAGQKAAQDPDRAYPALTIPGGESWRDLAPQPAPKGRVRVERVDSADAAADKLAAAARRGAACLWVRNAVDEAIAAVGLLRERGVASSLLHARFALADRKRIETIEMARFGKWGSGREGRVLVATQVVESSLDLDFDVMLSDLAPMAALIQRAGRLWRHMEERPYVSRPVPEPVLYVLSPDPALVRDKRWLLDVLGAGGWVYPLADQWRTADILFRIGAIEAPAGLRALIEAVHTDKAPVPEILAAAEAERIGEGYAKANIARQNLLDLKTDYRNAHGDGDDRIFPTRLGPPTQTLVLARSRNGRLIPWADRCGGSEAEAWMLSEVQADAGKLKKLSLPDQTEEDIAAVIREWPDWRREAMILCPVTESGKIAEGLRYDSTLGLLL
ncbi:MAG: CRISPR-associated helicase Cas3' [Rhodospirillaceae bacterium]|nr:CRISPR-associated helicase Cas3' [Rhodospirillaceae bacterium]